VSARAICHPAGRSGPRPATRSRAGRFLARPLGIWWAPLVSVSVAFLVAPAPLPADDAPAQVQQELERMSEVDKTALLQKKRRFDDLPAGEQDRLRKLHDELLADPDQPELQRVLERYSNWLRTLAPRERAEVISLPADKRIEKISELMRAQDAKRFRMMASGFMLDSHDLTVVHDWFDKFIDDHAQEILKTLPDELFGKLKKDYEPERDRGILRRLYLGPAPPNLPRPSHDDEAQLQTQVSKEARDMLTKVSAEERSQVIQRWMGAAVFSRMRTNPSSEELQAFQESLTESERIRLESLPRDRMYRELRYMYSLRRFGGGPDHGGFPWGRRGGDGQRGPEGGRAFDGPPPDGPGPPPWDFRGPPPPPDRNRPDGPPPGEGPAMPGRGKTRGQASRPDDR
jgi:hypothetical protein